MKNKALLIALAVIAGGSGRGNPQKNERQVFDGSSECFRFELAPSQAFSFGVATSNSGLSIGFRSANAEGHVGPGTVCRQNA